MRWLLLFIIYYTRHCIAQKTIKQLGFQLTRLLVHQKDIYIAGANKVIRLDDEFNILATLMNGPIMNNMFCHPTSLDKLYCAAEHKEQLEDNINKILLYTEKPKPMVITCGSVYQGICQFLDVKTLQNVTEIYAEKLYTERLFGSHVFVSSNGKDTSATAFIKYGSEGARLIGARTITVKPVFNELYAISSILLGKELKINTFYVTQYVKGIPYSKDGYFFNNTAKYHVNYLSSFEYDNDVYFTLTYRYNNKDPIVSKMSRVKFDNNGYLELPLICEKNGVQYNEMVTNVLVKLISGKSTIPNAVAGDEVLFASFKSEVTSKYAVCTFLMKDVVQKINEAFSNCDRNEVVPWAKPSTICENMVLAPITIVVNGEILDVFDNKIGGMAGFPHERGLSLYVSSGGQKIAGYDVSTKGLFKFSVDNFGGDDVFQQMLFGPINRYIYAISDSAVVKVPIKDCNSRKSCKVCLAGPSCGWCTLEGRCTEKESCPNNEKINYFIETSYDLCPVVSNLSPNVSSIEDIKQIMFDVTNIPTDVSYECLLGSGYLVGATLESGTNVTCDSTIFKSIPNYIATERGDAEVKLALLYQNHNVVSSKIVIYDCTSLKMCKSCITGPYQCGWCPKSMTCSMNENGCRASFVNYLGLDSNKYDQHCPQIISVVNKYLPSDVDRDIVLTGNLLPVEDSRKFKCDLKIEGTTQSTTAERVSGNKLICNKKSFSFTGSNSTLAELSVTFGNVPIYVNKVTVQLYKCGFGRGDCSSCLAAPSVLGCGWCKSKGTCGVSEQCPQKVTTKCPSPIINSVTPSIVSSGGGTKIIITGTNFGVSPAKVLDIKLAGFPCMKTDESKQNYIVCVATASNEAIKGNVKMLVDTSDGRKTGEYQGFEYKVPSVISFSPKVGTCAGGTILTILGENLNLGNKIEITIGQSPCNDIVREGTGSNSTIKCQTSGRTKCKQSKRRRRQISDGDQVRVTMDGYQVPNTDRSTFLYEKNPTVHTLHTNTRSIDPKIFVSGGQEILFAGLRLNIVQNCKMVLYTQSPKARYEIDCKYNGAKMVCLSPNVSDIATTKTGKQRSFNLSTEIIMDGHKTEFKSIVVVPDPVFDQFPDGVRVVRTDDLILTGRNLENIVTKDVKVKVGGIACNVTDLDQRLVCKLPTKEKVLASSKYSDKALIEVFVGLKGLSYKLGFIKFYTPSTQEVPMDLYVGLSVGLLILIIIIIIIVCCVMKRKKRLKDERYHELIQIRMDRMESQYARECKEAFAEYQTEITDLTQDVKKMVSPYLDFPQYAMRVLYPGLTSHPILEPNRDSRPEWESSMKSLIVLLKDKEFLLTFVRTLESQSGFQMTDRCAVASLLMVSLQDDLQYVTDILMELLKDLINKPGKKRPKLLLRRTESVAEKLLTTWLAYNLHGFLEDHVGQPLFNLFSAVNILLEKEPVDAITSDAKNSLSEDKLLRQKIDFKSITIDVEYVDDSNTKENYEGIPVLTCDTITQTKEKIVKYIYKGKPYSLWPPLDGFDLGFPSVSGAMLVLNDEDSTNIVEGEYKKINTLEHYKVPDKAKLRLAATVTVQNDTFNESSAALSNNISLPSVNFSTSTPMLQHVDNNEPKLWHMVKTTDYPQEQRQKEDIRHSKMMAEVFLTRLLKTKETLQLFVNELFDSIFGLHEGGRKIPPAIKYLFDFLDQQAVELQITEDEVRHTWKNNSLPLRFWINIIKNPNFVFDIKKSNTVDSCLSVIAQLFMDSCSPDEHRLGKDSPSNKLLYAKEIPEYKKKVERYYNDIAASELREKDFHKSLDEISKKHGDNFNGCNAARELLDYAEHYKVQIFENLERNNQMGLYDDLQDILTRMPDD